MFVNTYCLPMNCIVAPLNGCGGIYLGNVDAAQNQELLQQNNIGAVLQVLDHSVQIKGVQKLWIMAEDSEDFPLNKYFEQAIRFIENQSKKTNVLIHCYAGISRSAALVIVYLMNKYNWSFNQAMLHTQSKRRIVQPNQGFIKQLKEFEKKISKQQQQGQQQVCKSRLDDFNNKLDQFRHQLRIRNY